MTDTKLPTAALLEPTRVTGVLPTTKGDLIVLPPPPPPSTTAELAVVIRQGHREVEAATVDAVRAALRTGEALVRGGG